jgi:hypothetical protein
MPCRGVLVEQALLLNAIARRRVLLALGEPQAGRPPPHVPWTADVAVCARRLLARRKRSFAHDVRPTVLPFSSSSSDGWFQVHVAGSIRNHSSERRSRFRALMPLPCTLATISFSLVTFLSRFGCTPMTATISAAPATATCPAPQLQSLPNNLQAASTVSKSGLSLSAAARSLPA